MKKLFVIAALAVVAWATSANAWVPPQNHYLCHQVKDLKNPKFVKIEGNVVVDQTFAGNCTAIKPALLCNPANKNGNPIVDASLHYCCYKVKCSSKPSVSYFISDQFGVHQVVTKKPKFLCNPCDKF